MSFSAYLRHLVKNIPSLDAYTQIKRRIYLSRIGGYPKWKSIIASEVGSSNFYPQLAGDKKILIATSIGSHLAAMQMETTIAAALSIRGCNVHALLCDGVLPGCQMCEPRFFVNTKSFAINGPQKDLCGHCYKPGRRVYEEVGIPVHAYSDNLTSSDITLADKISSEIAISDIETFIMDGLRIGEHAKAGALRFYARATIDGEPFVDSVLRRYLKAAILTALSAKKLFKREKYDVIVFHHGIYVPQGIIGEVARQQGIEVVTWNPAYRKNCFIFSHEDTYHHTLMHESVSAWENMDWTDEKENVISEYLRSRWSGENDWIRFHENPYFEKDKILSEIGCDAARPIIGCLTNVMWDAQLHYPANAFANMLDWLIFTVEYFAKHPELQLVIRIHPAEIRGSVPTRQPVADELRKHFPKLPDNVFVVLPDSNISTYVLSEMCDSVIIFGTKTGVELVSVGIPVIVAGEAWIRNKGLTMDAVSPASYRRILELLPIGKRLDESIISRAKKYAYHFFFRRMIQVNFFQKGPGWPPYCFKGSLQDLKPGQDVGLDCICNGIIYSTPFISDTVVKEKI